MEKRRVVITGLGLITPLGLDVKTTWQAILNGQSGVERIPAFQQAGYPTQIAALVKDFDPERYFSIKEVKKFDPFIHFGVAAAKEAIENSRLFQEKAALNMDRIGVLIGSGIGGLATIDKNAVTLANQGHRKISPFFITGSIINTLSGYVCMQYGFHGPNFGIVSACATGSHSIGQAMRIIQYGDADVMITGGAEMASTHLGVSGFSACRALSQNNEHPKEASRPWDKKRDGFVMGEGAGVLVLESYEHAKARNAPIYAELIGFGMSSDAFHLTAPHPEALGAKLAIMNTLRDAQLEPSQIDYVNAHATSTPLGDEPEVKAIKEVFGDYAYQLPVSSTKSMTGHLLGAAGSVEAAFCVLALQDQIIPPTINLDDPSEDCDLDFVPHKPREVKLNHVLSNSFGFGGTNATLVFKRMS